MGWNINMKKMLLMLLSVCSTFVASASVSVSDVVCTPRYPWNGLVDVDYTVGSDNPNEDICVWPTAYDVDANVPRMVRTLSGEGAQTTVKPGLHRLTWNVGADYPGLATTAMKIDLQAVSGRRLYMVVNLAGGPNAESYPVTYLAGIPEGGWSETYKTTNLVLRLILPGTFLMGSPETESWRGNDEYLHRVTLTKPFYIGVFELTQKQWELVMGSNPARYKGDARPVGSLSYGMVRGGNKGLGWPANDEVDADSFLGRLRSRTDFRFDLPTEAQWEYACRAGTTTALPNGRNLTSRDVCPNVAEVARYCGNVDDGKGGYTGAHTTVGSYLPNVWGLYDVIGNVCELCRDRWQSDLRTLSPVDPKGSSTETPERAYHSDWARDDKANQSRSARRASRGWNAAVDWLGCRLSLTLTQD